MCSIVDSTDGGNRFVLLFQKEGNDTHCFTFMVVSAKDVPFSCENLRPLVADDAPSLRNSISVEEERARYEKEDLQG